MTAASEPPTPVLVSHALAGLRDPLTITALRMRARVKLAAAEPSNPTPTEACNSTLSPAESSLHPEQGGTSERVGLTPLQLPPGGRQGGPGSATHSHHVALG